MTPEHQAQHEAWKEARARLNAPPKIAPSSIAPRAASNVVELVPATVDPEKEVMDFIVAAVGNHAGLPVNEIISGPPTREVTLARNLAMALCVRRLGFSPKRVAEHFEVEEDSALFASRALQPILAASSISHKTQIELVLPVIWSEWCGDLSTAPCPTVQDIQRSVCRAWGIDKIHMVSHRRTKEVVTPRQVAMALSRRLTLKSLPEIGRRFGGRDHTTVLHAVNKMKDAVAFAGEGYSEKSTPFEWAVAIRAYLEAR